MCWNFATRLLDFPKAFSSVSKCPSECSPGALGPHSERLHWFTGHSRAQSRDQGVSNYYLTHEWERRLLDPSVIWGRIPKLPQSHFCLWIDAKLLLSETEDMTKGVLLGHLAYTTLSKFYFTETVIYHGKKYIFSS